MTRVEAAAFVETLDAVSSEELEHATREFAHAMWMSGICAETRSEHWKQQLWACRERLIDVLSGSESTVPTVRPL